MNFPSPADGGINSDFDRVGEFVDTPIHDDRSYGYPETASSSYLSSGSLISDGDDSSKPPIFCESCSSSHFRSSWENTTCDDIKIKLIDGELSPEEVRWFHKSDNDKRWIEFSGYDSIRIEQAYRKTFRRQFPKSSEEKDTLSESVGITTNICDVFSKSNNYSDNTSRKGSVSSTPSSEHPLLEPESNRLNRCIGVRGGMYEVDLDLWKCASIYWPGEECAVMRGTWFYDGSWQPLESPYCDTLESEHLNLFYGDKLVDSARDDPAKVAKSALHKKSFPDFHVEWHTSREVYLYSEATSSKLVRSVTQKLGFQKSYRLYRGYKVPATLSDRPVDVTHLVFVIHGIGQKMDTGNIIRNSTAFRDCVSWLKQKYFPSSSHLRIEFFPVEWRSSLKLDGDIVEAITPHKVLGLRQILNESAMDVMYYTSPLYGAEVRQGLCTELNRLYSMFTRHNKNFERNKGKVSVLAHSLGCVILYDIVTGWPLPDTASHYPQFGDNVDFVGDIISESIPVDDFERVLIHIDFSKKGGEDG
ncbi:hypothetical protein J437_LFUL014350, partial [Ladona fulva]